MTVGNLLSIGALAVVGLAALAIARAMRAHHPDPIIDDLIRPPRQVFEKLENDRLEQLRVTTEERRRRAALAAQASRRILSGGQVVKVDDRFRRAR